jgi:hypothetical protein
MAYDSLGREIFRKYGIKSTFVEMYRYDSLSRKVEEIRINSRDTTRLRLTFDKNGRNTAYTVYKGQHYSSGYKMRYDRLGRLVEFSEYSNDPQTPFKKISIQYNKNGLPEKTKVKHYAQSYVLKYQYEYYP